MLLIGFLAVLICLFVCILSTTELAINSLQKLWRTNLIACDIMRSAHILGERRVIFFEVKVISKIQVRLKIDHISIDQRYFSICAPNDVYGV